MSSTMIATLIGAGLSLMTTIVTIIINVFIEKNKNKLAIKNDMDKLKREYLRDVYHELINAINLYPNISPNDVLKDTEHIPQYCMESFEPIIKELDYQIENCKKQLDNQMLCHEQKNEIELQLSNLNYSKKRIVEICDAYYQAKEKYKLFCEFGKAKLDLYAEQNVRECLIEFEVVINQIFICGCSVGEVDNPFNNAIDKKRNKLVDSIRNDMGI